MKKLFKGINVPGTVVITLVGGFLFAMFVDPVLDVAREFSGNILTFLVDLHYRCASTSDMSTIIFTFAYSAFLFFLMKFSGDIDREYSHLKELSKELNPSNAKECLHEKKNDTIVVDNIAHAKRIIKRKRILNFNTLLLFIWFFMIVAYIWMPILKKNSFDINIVMVTPYIDDNEISLLKSDWVRMKSKSDYDDINDRIAAIVIEHDLK